MPKAEVSDVVRRVAEALTEEPKTVAEIAESAGVSWEGAKRALELLVWIGVAVTDKEGKRVKYRKKGDEWIGYFRIPVSREDAKMIRNAYGIIKKAWRDATGKEPTKTQMHKVLAKINKEFGLGVPMGKYSYGIVAVLPYEEGEAYPLPEGKVWEKIYARVYEIAREYGEKPVWRFVKDHYREFGLKAHELKGIIFALLGRLSKDSVPNVSRLLTDLLIELDDRESREYLAEFMGHVNNLVFVGEITDELRGLLVDVFDKIWEFAATKMFYTDLLKYYDDAQLTRVKADLEQRREEVVEVMGIFRDAVLPFVPKPSSDEPDTLMGAAKE